MKLITPIYMKPTPIYNRDLVESCNDFFDCPLCGKYRFRIDARLYSTPFWEELSLSCLCLGCSFGYKKTLVEPFTDGPDFDLYDFIIGYFKEEKKL